LAAVSSAAVAQGLASAPLELCQRRAQPIEARGAKKPVVFDGAPDRRRYGGVLVVGKSIVGMA
jgi:hypothetical protein